MPSGLWLPYFDAASSDERQHQFVKGQCSFHGSPDRQKKSSAIRRGLVLFASAEGGTMRINRLLKDKRTPEEIELLNMAFNRALSLLGVVDRNDPFCDMVARKVIEVRATGINGSREIAEIAVRRMGLR
jgi:hypothetical protein